MKRIVPDASLPWPERLDWIGADRMATTIEPVLGAPAGRNGPRSRLAESVRIHRTLCIGILYVIAISVILAFVARL